MSVPSLHSAGLSCSGEEIPYESLRRVLPGARGFSVHTRSGLFPSSGVAVYEITAAVALSDSTFNNIDENIKKNRIRLFVLKFNVTL